MACGAVGLVGASIVGASALGGPSTQLLKGTISVTDSDGLGGSTSSCYGEGGYSDLESGTQVTVKNGDDKLLATTSLGTGTGRTVREILEDAGRSASIPSSSSAGNSVITCTFPFEAKVPKGEKFYAVAIGSSGRRGTLSYSKDDLEKNDWTVSFTIG